MHLKKIHFRNFRCFDSLEIDLHERLTVFVAGNGGGKTAVLDGIAIGLSVMLRILSSANQRLYGPSVADTDFRLESWTLRGDERWGPSDFAQVMLESVDGVRWDHWRPSSSGKQPESKIGQAALSERLSATFNSLKSANRQLLPVVAYYGARRGWIEVPERLRKAKLRKINYDFPTSALFGALDALSDFKEMLKWFDEQESSELRANKGYSPEDYSESPLLSEVRATVARILGEDYSNPRFNRKHKFVISAQAGPDELQVSQLSQGYQSMLALGMDFARRLALANDHIANGFEERAEWPFVLEYFQRWQPESQGDTALIGPCWAPAIMLVDEIDLHLHPSWQQRVLGDLMRAFPGTQFIVTTHSPQVLTTVKPENLRVLRRDEQGKWLADDKVPNTYGHSNSRSLEAAMGGRAYPEHLHTVAQLREYQRLVGQDLHDSERAVELRTQLEAVWGKNDPELQLMDISIRKNEVLRKLKVQGT